MRGQQIQQVILDEVAIKPSGDTFAYPSFISENGVIWDINVDTYLKWCFTYDPISLTPEFTPERRRVDWRKGNSYLYNTDAGIFYLPKNWMLL